MKKILILTLIITVVLLASCTTTTHTKYEDLYLTTCVLPGDGSGLVPGTFILPDGTMVVLGNATIVDNYLYASGNASPNNDVLAAMETARIVCREAMSKYINSTVSGTSSRTSVTVDGITSNAAVSGGTTDTYASLKGVEDCGYVLGSDGTTYVLARISIDNIKEIDTPQKQALKKRQEIVDRTRNKFIDKMTDSLLNAIF